MSYTANLKENMLTDNSIKQLLKANTKIYKGSAVFVSNGVASNALEGTFIGIAKETCSNIANDIPYSIYVDIDMDKVGYFFTSLTSANVGETAYIKQTADNRTITNYAGLNLTLPYVSVGKISEVTNGIAKVILTGLNDVVIPATPVVSVVSLSILPTSIDIFETENATIVPTVLPAGATDKSVRFVSTNSNIATVTSGGVVTGVNNGSCDILVMTVDGNFIAFCNVVIKEYIEVTGVSLNKETTTLAVEGTETLVATVAPNDANVDTVTWTSSAPLIATVSNAGLVTAIALGEATITVTTTEGDFTDTCVVTVS